MKIDWLHLYSETASMLRLLYWAYFKPYTFAEYLRTIHPELTPTSNLYDFRQHISDNQRLAIYARQAKHLAQLVPLVIVLTVGVLYSLFVQPFDWIFSLSYVISFIIGTEMSAQSRKVKLDSWGDRATNILGLIFFAPFLIYGLLQFTLPTVAETIANITLDLIQSLVAILPLFLRDILPDLARVAGGVAVGVAGGVAGGVAVGVAGGVAMIVSVLRLYFWLPQLLWMFILWFVSPNEQAAHRLRWLPTHYDEFIVLPLPLLGNFLATAYRYNQAGARQVIDRLTTHSRQQGAARTAQLLIALDQLARCDSPQALAGVHRELRWVAAPPPELGAVLPALLDISQNVSTALAATTHYRQRLGLEEQLAALQRLREQLVNTSQHAFAFGQIVDHWRTILQGAVHVLTTQQTRDTEIPPVYIAGPHLRPHEARQLFKGRHSLFTEIENLLLAPRPPVLALQGQRRTGKTSLLAYLPERLPADLIPVTVNLQDAATAESNAGLVYQMTRNIVASARQGRNLQLREWPQAEFQYEPFLALNEWLLREVEKVAPNRKFLLCLDEFDRLEPFFQATGSHTVRNFLRNFLEHRQAWRLLFVSSRPPGEIAPYWSDTLINARRLSISYLTEAETRELIEEPTPDFRQQMRYEAAAVDAIFALTHGQPFLVQLLCLDLVNHLNQAHRHTVVVDDVDVIIDPALAHGGYYFDELWQSASPTEQAILSAIAHGQSPPPDTAALRALCQRELLALMDGNYQFQVPLIARWVKQQHYA